MRGQDSLELFDFGVLLQALSNNLKVGVLAVRSGKREKYLHLDRSTLRCVYTRQPRVTLQKVLYNRRAIGVAQLREAAEVLGADRTEHQLAQYLYESAYISEEQLRRAWNYQLIEEVLELFYWKNIGFEFYSGAEPAMLEELAQRRQHQVGDPIAVDTILINCTKIQDDIEKFNSVTPSLRDVYELRITSLDELERLVPDVAQREFMLLIDGVRDMREILRDMRMNRFEVLELFYRFRKEGRIRPKNAFELLMLAENRRKEFEPAKRARVLERVAELGVEGFGVLLPLAQTYEDLKQIVKAAECYVKHARQCIANGDFDAALDAVRRAELMRPHDAGIRRFEVEVLRDAGRPDEAGEALKTLSDVLRAGGDVHGARKALENAIRVAPQDPAVWRALGELLAAEEEERPAASRVRRAGDRWMEVDSPLDAVDCYRRVLELWPDAWSARYRLADALHAAKRDDQAVQELADLVEYVRTSGDKIDAGAAGAHLGRVETRLRAMGGLASSAARHLANALRQSGRAAHAADILRESARMLVAAKRHPSAVEAYGELVELRPDEVDARRELARCNAALGDRNRALSQLRRAAQQLISKGRLEEALGVYEEMLTVDPGCLDAHCGLAKTLLDLGEDQRAAEHYHRVGLLHRGCGRAAEAIPYLREAVEKRPADSVLLEEYCELLSAVGTDQKELLAALNALVDLRMQRGRPARAAIALQQILEIDPRYPGAKDILRNAAAELAVIAQSSREVHAEEVERVLQRARSSLAAADPTSEIPARPDTTAELVHEIVQPEPPVVDDQ